MAYKLYTVLYAFNLNKMITDNKIQICEDSIINFAEGLGISEKEVVEILKEGMLSLSPIANQLSNTNKYFIDEMEAIFDMN